MVEVGSLHVLILVGFGGGVCSGFCFLVGGVGVVCFFFCFFPPFFYDFTRVCAPESLTNVCVCVCSFVPLTHRHHHLHHGSWSDESDSGSEVLKSQSAVPISSRRSPYYLDLLRRCPTLTTWPRHPADPALPSAPVAKRLVRYK